MAKSPSVIAAEMFDDGASYEEIAAAINAPVEHVERLLKARAKLRANPHVGTVREILRVLAEEQDAEREGRA